MPEVWAPKAELAVTDSGDRLAILDLDHPDRPVVILEGPARDIWLALGESTAASPDVEPFVRQLRSAGLTHRRR